MQLQLSVRTEITVIQTLEVAGGMTGSIFPEAEALLFRDEYVEALQYVAARKKMKRYRSVIDFIFVELFPEWRRACFLYYQDAGKPLRELLSVGEVRYYSRIFLKALEISLRYKEEEEGKSWRRFRRVVHEAVA